MTGGGARRTKGRRLPYLSDDFEGAASVPGRPRRHPTAVGKASLMSQRMIGAPALSNGA